MKIAKGLRVKTEAGAHIVIRDGTGRKLFDMSLLRGVSITLTASIDAEIKVEPQPAPRSHTK